MFCGGELDLLTERLSKCGRYPDKGCDGFNANCVSNVQVSLKGMEI